MTVRPIAIATDDLDWHARELLRACDSRNLAATTFRLADAAFDSAAPSGIAVPGFPSSLPAAVLVRAVSGGSFEEVTRRLGILHALGECGVLVWNDARAIERCVDKAATGFMLAHAGVATPPAWVVEGRDAACTVVAREVGAGPLVLKPLFGSQGRGLRLIEGERDLPEPSEVGGVFYLQRFLSRPGQTFSDHRLFVCAGTLIGAMTREAKGWITNIKLGGTPVAFGAPPDLVDLAVRATRAVGAAYAGVDILRDGDGRPHVLEVNSMPGWRGLQRVLQRSVADAIVDALVAALD